VNTRSLQQCDIREQATLRSADRETPPGNAGSNWSDMIRDVLG
jgi:hypothetical protein